jgi:hypothetical protein
MTPGQAQRELELSQLVLVRDQISSRHGDIQLPRANPNAILPLTLQAAVQ